jgi:glycosyltransferase involved in cell wall biosynthesis
MKLIIVHSHLRPGGVRRVIEQAAPHLVRHLPAVTGVVVAAGEDADAKWTQEFRNALGRTQVQFLIEPVFGYFSEQRRLRWDLERRLHDAVERLLTGADGKNTLVWLHNPGLARNLLLVREVTRACGRRGVPLVMHHHDWWFDNRWQRWPEMRRAGFRTLDAAARAVFPPVQKVHHITINSADATRLKRHLSTRAGWLPNPAHSGAAPPATRVAVAREWLRGELGGFDGPVWIAPCRLLRRKNIAEALLLARWLRPEAWLVTTGGPSSEDEQCYFDRLDAAVRDHGWRLRLAIFRGDERDKPSVPDLLAASEAVMLTSIQEGFGLPYIEAAVAGRPLIARSIPDVAPDLRKFGFRFPQGYDDIRIDPRLFDLAAEKRRQRELYHAWRRRLPAAARWFAGLPALLESGSRVGSVAFSRLTLTAQLEVLARPAVRSWELCAPLNPFLGVWRAQAARGALEVTRWPAVAGDWLGGPAYAARFAKIISRGPVGAPLAAAGRAVQKDFLRDRLRTKNLFPLLWNTET